MNTNLYHDKLFSSIPGAWYGNMPKPENGQPWGVVTVDVEKIIPAIRFLSRHYEITKTCLPDHGIMNQGGVMIKFSMKN